MAANARRSSKSITREKNRRLFKTRWLNKSAIARLRQSKRAFLVVLLLASSAVALTSLGIRHAMLSGNDAAFVSQSVPATMTAGETYAVTVSMPNQGTTTWTPGQAYRLGSQNPQDNGTWGGRVYLSAGDSVSPGATATFSFVVTAPSSPGSYNFQWRMVQDGVEWFGATTPNIAVQVVPRPALTKLKEYVYAGGRLITSEEKSCVPTLSPLTASQPVGGGTGSFDVSISECNWNATSSAEWITINGATSGVGPGNVSYSVAANSGPQRTGTITVNGQAFTITQDPNQSTCAYSLNKSSELFSDQAGSRSVNLTTGGGCSWSASSSNPDWLTITPPTSGRGSATIDYAVTANNSGAQRTGAITIGGQTLTITQPPNQNSCTFTLSPGSWLYGIEGGGGSFNVTTGAGCFWDAATNVGWITITGGATGIGNGTVSFTVQANNGGSRTGAISVRGQVFTVTQCGYVISPTSATFTQHGGSGSVTVSAAAGCSWSATSNKSWITITSGSNGSGNGVVNYDVDTYDECAPARNGTITVAGRTVVIAQFVNGGPCCIDPTCCMDPSCLLATGAGAGGLTARYFGNTTLSGQQAIERIDPAINFRWAGRLTDKVLPRDGFSARWSGQLAAPSSEAYTFYLYSDGGARLWVNNQLVIDRWRPSSDPYTRSAPVELKVGEKAPIRVEYYAGENAAIHLLWSSASTRKQIISPQYLYPEAATNLSTPADTGKQTGILLPPGADAGLKATRPYLNKGVANPFGRAGLALLIACSVLVLLIRTRWRQARRGFATVAACNHVATAGSGRLARICHAPRQAKARQTVA